MNERIVRKISSNNVFWRATDAQGESKFTSHKLN